MQEECARSDDGLRLRLEGNSDEDNGDTDVVQDRKSVRDMILQFETTAIRLSTTSEKLVRRSDPFARSLTSIVNPLQTHFHNLHPVISHDRTSSVSVNSVLSDTSELSCTSSSSGFISDQKSCKDFRVLPVPHRPAPPPPDALNDRLTDASKSPEAEEMASSERRYSLSTSSGSPVVLRRSRQPPVIRRKSSINSIQGHGETLWSYGIKQADLVKLLNLRRSDTSNESKEIITAASASDNVIDSSDDSSGARSDEDETSVQCSPRGDGQDDTLSRDHSTDTLRNDDGDDGDDNSSIASVQSGERSNYDNVSIKSISSFDMIPYQKYDSITVSSDEFGSEVCHAPDTEFLTVSAINEWCVSNSAETASHPTETKREKYRRRLTERVNELIHTEQGYVERLRHVVEDYIPSMLAEDVPDELQELKPDIFSNIERIHSFHAEEFLPALQDCENDLRKLGQCFRSFEQKFYMYVMYSRSNKRATRLVYEHKDFFHEKQMQLSDRLDLTSYLLEPVQRIPRYKLFLEDLVKTYKNYELELADAESGDTAGSEGEEEPPLRSLGLAKAMVEHVLTAIDDIMALENIRDCPSNINLLHQGSLLRQGEFIVVDQARRRQLMRLFLFEKLLLLAAVYRKKLTVEVFLYKDHIPMDDLGITAKEHDKVKFSVWYKKRTQKSYKMETTDPAVRSLWVKDITSLLWKQAMRKKEMLDQPRGKRAFMTLDNRRESTGDDIYCPLRGAPDDLQMDGDPTVRRTTWYCQ